MKPLEIPQDLIDHLDGLMDDSEAEGADDANLQAIAERHQNGETTQADIDYLRASLEGKHDAEAVAEAEPEPEEGPAETEPEAEPEPEPTPVKAPKKAAKPKAKPAKAPKPAKKPAKKTREPRKPSPTTALIQGAAAGARVITKKYDTAEEAFAAAYKYWGTRRRLGLQDTVGVSLNRGKKTVTVGPRADIDAMLEAAAEAPKPKAKATKTAKGKRSKPA